MFIYHFHRIIRHRLVWGVFAIVVSLAFLSVDSCYRSNKSASSMATIGGQQVADTTFNAMEREIRGLGRNRKDSAPFPTIATQVWLQVAAFQVADELKLGVSREEIKQAVQESIGATEGYDSTVHANYLAKLKDLSLTPSIYEGYLAHVLKMRKLGAVVESAAWVTPVEIDDELAGLTDEMVVRTIAVSNRFTGINATEPQIRAFFDAHTNSFRLPKRVAVQYVAISISNYLPRVSVSEEQVKEYLDDHSDKFTRSNSTETLSLADARPLILPILRHQEARQAAYTNLVHTFLATATNGPGFLVAAVACGLPVHSTPFFAVDETPAGIDAGKEFRDAAFDLDPVQAEGYCNVVPGEHFVYAIAPLTNSPAHMPALEEVMDRVRPLAVSKVRADAFHDYLDSLHKDLVKGLRENRSLPAVAQAKALNVSTSITFAVHTLYQNPFDNYMPVARAALHLQPGELSEASLADEDAAVFVYMEARHPGDSLSADMLRPRARATIERARAMGLNATWMEWNLARKGLVVSPRIVPQLTAQSETARGED